MSVPSTLANITLVHPDASNVSSIRRRSASSNSTTTINTDASVPYLSASNTTTTTTTTLCPLSPPLTPDNPSLTTQQDTTLSKINAPTSLTRTTDTKTGRRRAIHEHAKRNQRLATAGNGKGVLSFMYRHQLDVPAYIMATVFACHFAFRIPAASVFLVLQNKDPLTGLYSKTWTDLYFIGFGVIVFTFLRAFVMTFILKPIAVTFGARNEHRRNRFQEEGWVCMYYTLSWSMGMYVLGQSPVWNNWIFWFKPEAFFDGYPHTRLPHGMLWYYYVQLAFWLQQVFVLQVEVPRKDFWALMTHHTVTLLLIGGSALSNFWRAGNAVFVVMDLSDIILAFSKSIKYLGVASRVCDTSFGIFMASWLYTRHYLYGYILHSFMFTAYEMIPFELNIAEGKWYCRELAWLPVLGLALLQVLMVYWFAMILKIVLKILKGESAEDDRSDDEHEPAETVLSEKKHVKLAS